jgi:hypothetical protein
METWCTKGSSGTMDADADVSSADKSSNNGPLTSRQLA